MQLSPATVAPFGGFRCICASRGRRPKRPPHKNKRPVAAAVEVSPVRMNASHLFYAMVVLVSVFLMVAVSGPSNGPLEYAPLATTITNCDPDRLDLPCAAPTSGALVGGEVRVS